MKEIEQEKTIFTMQMEKSFMMVLYRIFIVIWDLVAAFACIIFMTLDQIIPNIMGFVFIMYIPYYYFYEFVVKGIDYHDDYFVIKKIFYNDLKYYWQMALIRETALMLKFKKHIFNISINERLFKKEDIKKIKEILNSKNIYEYSFL